MILPPSKENELMQAKELADHTGIALSVIYAARSGGFPMPGRQATPAELNAWIASHSGERNERNDATASIDYQDALRYPKDLVGAAKVSRSFFFSARRLGFPLDSTGRSTVRMFRAWLVAHPDFRAEHGFNRKNKKGRSIEACWNFYKLPSNMRIPIDKSKWKFRKQAQVL